MRLISFRTPGGIRLGVATVAGVVDVAAMAAELGLREVPVTVEDVLSGGEAAQAKLATVVEAGLRRGADGLLREAELDLGPCVSRPGKIICVGLNYRQHAEESGMKLPESPVLFSKFPNTLAGHGDLVSIPPDVTQMDYEAELVIVMGRRCRGVSQAEALAYVGGYCSGDDLSARDLQFRTSQWLLGKTSDGFCPIGPYLVTADEVPNPNDLRIQCDVNGERRQDSSTADMIFPCDYIISYISRYMTLEPGDLILTGTPQGVALGRPDKPWLKPGDRVTVEIVGLGALTNTIAGA